MDCLLKKIMANIFKACEESAKEYGMPGKLHGGRQHRRIHEGREAMKAQGCV